MSPTIRRGRPGEGAALAALFHEAVHILCAADYDAAERHAWSPAPDAAPFERRITETMLWVAEGENGALLGFANLAPHGYFDCLYVAPEAAGQGVATALCTVLEQEAQRQGCPRLTVDVSITARPFFERRGYRLLREQQVERRGVFLTNYRQEKVFFP